MTTLTLKIIACASMLCDHVAYLLFEPGSIKWQIGRILGRSAFFLFSFLLVEGYYCTGNIKKYLIRIGVFAVLSEIAFDFATSDCFGEDILVRQNVFFTLLTGLTAIILLERIKLLYINRSMQYNLFSSLVIMGAILFTWVIKSDYPGIGVVCILIFYFFRGNKKMVATGMVLWVLLCYLAGAYGEEWGLVALIPIFLYNGQRGRYSKYIFYIFYPAHLILLGFIRYTFY